MTKALFFIILLFVWLSNCARCRDYVPAIASRRAGVRGPVMVGGLGVGMVDGLAGLGRFCLGVVDDQHKMAGLECGFVAQDTVLRFMGQQIGSSVFRSAQHPNKPDNSGDDPTDEHPDGLVRG